MKALQWYRRDLLEDSPFEEATITIVKTYLLLKLYKAKKIKVFPTVSFLI